MKESLGNRRPNLGQFRESGEGKSIFGSGDAQADFEIFCRNAYAPVWSSGAASAARA